MPAYAGFKDLGDYLARRSRERGISFRELSLELGFGHGYIQAIANGDFKPRRNSLDKVSSYFDDSPRILRVLAGLESPPADTKEPLVADILDVALSLPLKGRREMLEYGSLLKTKYSSEPK